jgi:hypothetical protein
MTIAEMAGNRMLWGDYVLVCLRQIIAACQDGRPLPDNFLDLEAGRTHTPEEFGTAADMAFELFGTHSGRWDYVPRGTCERLYEVERLTLKESAIAARMDLTHPEKIELIKPLRQEREARSDAYWDRVAAKGRAEDEKRIMAATAEAIIVTDDDRKWAGTFGLSLE